MMTTINAETLRTISFKNKPSTRLLHQILEEAEKEANKGETSYEHYENVDEYSGSDIDEVVTALGERGFKVHGCKYVEGDDWDYHQIDIQW